MKKENKNQINYLKENEQELLFKYVQDATNYECCVKSMTYFLNKMKKYLQRKGNEFYYLGVIFWSYFTGQENRFFSLLLRMY